MKNYHALLSSLFGLLLFSSITTSAQNEKTTIKRYLNQLPLCEATTQPQTYRMTAIYTNRDLVGNFLVKTKISGDYSMGRPDGKVTWNAVKIAESSKFEQPFAEGKVQSYMEDFSYVPSPKMLDAAQFPNFPHTPDAVYSRNLVWDMMALEGFAHDHWKALKLNQIFRIPNLPENFNMADIGTYNHSQVELCWTGLSAINDELCAIIEFRATDNLLKLDMPGLKSNGTEQYWGTIWVTLKTQQIARAEMYGGTAQELIIPGQEGKLRMKTIRELWVEKIDKDLLTWEQ